MGMFDDFMNMLDMGQRIAGGEGDAVKEEMLRDMRAKKDAPPAEPKACDKAPAGFRCTGRHDAKGRCMDLTVEGGEEPEP